MSGIYLHIPFCRQACTYCDFHFSTSLNNKSEVVKAILAEAALKKSYLGSPEISSIYFGGGTPSLLTERELADIMETLGSFFSWKSGIEITLEANPDDISTGALKDWQRLGINRLSIGLQSFNDEELKWMNRAHTAAESESSVKLAQDSGFGNISIDLIYGSKYQNLVSWKDTLNRAIALESQHVSAYNLTIENKTVLGLKHQKGAEPAVNEDLSSRQFLMMLDQFDSAGLVQYEISNFGKTGYFAVHNSNYWLQKKYLGLGPSAHSFNGTSRQWNVKNNGAYIKAIAAGTGFFEKEELSLNDRYNEYVLTRLRTIWGCDLSEIRTLFGEAILDHFTRGLEAVSRFVEEKNGVIFLNREGRLRADGIASDLFL
ncbi:MAG: radical SAM family heme chaperone HemW [Bacteroidota bacterium]